MQKSLSASALCFPTVIILPCGQSTLCERYANAIWFYMITCDPDLITRLKGNTQMFIPAIQTKVRGLTELQLRIME